MATACLLAAVWDQAVTGGIQFSFTDSAGSHGPVTTGSTGYVEHGSSGANGIAVTATVNDLTITSLGTLLKTTLETASPTKTYTVVFDATTGLYTISVNSGTLAITWSANKNILGFTADVSGSGSYTSPYVAKYAIKPAVAGLTNDTDCFQQSGSVKSAMSAMASSYRLAPTKIPALRSWEHHFEPKERCSLDYYTAVGGGTHLYTWEQMWADYSLAKLPIGCRVLYSSGRVEYFAFTLVSPEYTQTVRQRMRANDDVRFKIRVDGQLWPGASSTSGYARAFT